MKRIIALLVLAASAAFPTTADAGSTCVEIVVATISTHLRAGHCASTPGTSLCTFREVIRPSAYLSVTICVPDFPAPPPG